MGTLYNPNTDVSAEFSTAETERFRVALFESLKKHEIQKGFLEIAKSVKN